MVRVLVTGMTENPGGMESVIMNYYRHMDRTKVQFDFLSVTGTIAHENEIKRNGGNIYYIEAKGKHPLKNILQLKKFFQTHRNTYNIIWQNSCSLANIDYLKFAKQYGIPRRIIHCHNSQNGEGLLKEYFHKWNRQWVSIYATDFWTCSMRAAEWFFSKSVRGRVQFIPNAIDVDKYQYDEEKRKKIRQKLDSEDKYMIGNVGRLCTQKNQVFVLKIFAKALEREKDLRLVFVGQGEDEEKLRHLADSLHVTRQVYFAGVQDDIQRWMSAFDLLFMPSFFEGLSVVAMEAQANGLPILMSDSVIPGNAVVNDNIVRMNLDVSEDEWVNALIDMKENRGRVSERIKENMRMKHFDISCEVATVQDEFYEGCV